MELLSRNISEGFHLGTPYYLVPAHWYLTEKSLYTHLEPQLVQLMKSEYC